MFTKTRMFRGLVAASALSLAVSAYAQTPASPPQSQGAAPTPGTVTSPPVQMPGNTNMNGTTGSNSGMNGTNGSMRTDRMQTSRDYAAARRACDTGPSAQMTQCVNDANRRFNTVDPKCYSLNGNALNDCLGIK